MSLLPLVVLSLVLVALACWASCLVLLPSPLLRSLACSSVGALALSGVPVRVVVLLSVRVLVSLVWVSPSSLAYCISLPYLWLDVVCGL